MDDNFNLKIPAELLKSIDDAIHENIARFKTKISCNNVEDLNAVKYELLKLKQQKDKDNIKFNKIKYDLKEKLKQDKAESNKIFNIISNNLNKNKDIQKNNNTNVPKYEFKKFSLPKLPKMYKEDVGNGDNNYNAISQKELISKTKNLRADNNYNPIDYFNDAKIIDIFNKKNPSDNKFYSENKLAYNINSNYFDIPNDYFNKQGLLEENNINFNNSIQLLRGNNDKLNKYDNITNKIIINNDIDKKIISNYNDDIKEIIDIINVIK